MKKSIAITDLTRMQQGRVCIAGYDKDCACIRPTLPPPGISEKSLVANGQAILFPFAIVEFDLLYPKPQPPHREDYDYDPKSVRFIRPVKPENRERLLRQSLFENVDAIFEQPIHDDWGRYVMDGCGPRSLGTLQPREINEVIYGKDLKNKWDYRLKFVDGAGTSYRLKITDLTWHYFCDSQRDEKHEPLQIASMLTSLLKDRAVYLRIGLSRGWSEYPERCYLQINGVHTFPDYLNGRTFADFSLK